MAEIKSAIELAMEKTRDLVVGSKEREAMAMKELEDKVKAVLRRYIEEMIGPDDASKELNRINVDEALKKSITIDTLVEEFGLHKNNERLLALFHVAEIEIPQSLIKELEKLHNAFTEEVSAREIATREMIRKNLATMGITGNAFEPNLIAWNEWHEEREKAGNVFKENMEALKEKIRATKTMP
jgi:hypothetical protein